MSNSPKTVAATEALMKTIKSIKDIKIPETPDHIDVVSKEMELKIEEVLKGTEEVIKCSIEEKTCDPFTTMIRSAELIATVASACSSARANLDELRLRDRLIKALA